MTDNQTNIERFESLLKSVDREGIDGLISYFQKSDFYTAPASTRFHGNYEGGLLEHSLNVYDRLLSKVSDPFWKSKIEYDKDKFIIVALAHDICKTFLYEKELRNKKVYSDDGRRSDPDGRRYDWQSVECYTYNDKFPMGHGEKSMFMVERFIKLTKEEAMAIRWHMGFSEPKESYNAIGNAMQMYPLVLALHEADSEASQLMEETRG